MRNVNLHHLPQLTLSRSDGAAKQSASEGPPDAGTSLQGARRTTSTNPLSTDMVPDGVPPRVSVDDGSVYLSSYYPSPLVRRD